MKHITEQYGNETSRIECTMEEFRILKAFLAQNGVRLRATSIDFKGSEEIVIAQAINAYEFFSSLHRDGEQIREKAEEAISDECWML